MTQPMTTLNDALDAWIPQAVRRLADAVPKPRFDSVGRIESVGDGIARVSGLPETRVDELLLFPDGVSGLTVDLDAEIGCVLLGDGPGLASGALVHGTGSVLRVPVGDALMGRVLDPLGKPLDGGPPVAAERWEPVERVAPSIAERAAVSEPLLTGTIAIDAMFPIGRGQRELLIGDRATGKTAIAVDAILNQRGGDVWCVYAAIGQKSSTVRAVIEAVRRGGAAERTLVVMAGADTPPGLQWLAPYAAVTMAEYFRDRGQHALVVIDDLTKHAAVHRQLSLLLRRPPGREAYPGDVFHLHARLLERAAKLAPAKGGGSLTALPIAETQAGNLSAYIPTNLISITDGQIVLDTKLFQEGQKPAVDVGRSVSRVGGRAQPAPLRGLAEPLRLDYAQFLELEVFTRFGGMVDEKTRKAVAHGQRVRALLAQRHLAPQPLAVQVAQLLALTDRTLDRVPVEMVPRFRAALATLLEGRGAALATRLAAGADLDGTARADLGLLAAEAARIACLSDEPRQA
ncbi:MULTISPECIES: F0F1 ATP synthase subunit alpha [Azospirillum]|uniref:ATP synthase subunit alpha n=2 Tax=Azospirillum brasilense TaxID=192 RepID=A0ABU4NXT3_AZOBR|nr:MULTISPECIES: F0F1 ATP synthase subunit alpha [Azospirillum]MDW7554549.1 F0F1 ATP synthase subunit alpha [Azospirillum brasilense]MDW7593932.1 F0F1 ATP synthase subunit alpha [Azospirillum brasilense]MDW7632279.1 F0F1 ATP synthase subunit alpha [Azospirillum brasilense]MDX5950098.1 F0F1 ATP synthase subunit alpha [Azospirillum brasilense]PWC89051.1 ATP F0F1 synthase subunit alpha [Azospirillum sp. Sp 7]